MAERLSRRTFLRGFCAIMMAPWSLKPLFAETGPTPALAPVIRNGDRRFPRVALTFDDGWSKDQVREVLGILRRTNTRATFFIIGRAMDPETIREAWISGLVEFGNHSQTHPWLGQLTQAGILREIDAAQSRLNEILGSEIPPMKFFRPPYGDGVEWASQAASQRGLQTTLWDVDGGGARSNNQIMSSEVILRVVRDTQNGSIVLFHFIGSDIGALPAIINGLRSRGLELTTLSGLLAPLPIATRPIPPRFDR